MFLRRTTVTYKGKKRVYTQIVESYRRQSDGRPAHRIIANLGELTDPQFENLKAAFKASKQGKLVVPVRSLREGELPTKPENNLRYLDIAVFLSLWDEWGLDELCNETLETANAQVSPVDILKALVIQRCVDPGSKLYATRWYRTTALPELLGVSNEKFNNTRLHRVLDAVDKATPKLMEFLPNLYSKKDGSFAALFLDVTDTWFVGHGPEVAKNGKTKEGFIARKISIVLLCNEHGYPVRWEVLPGNQNDGAIMTGVLQRISGIEWVEKTPVIVDRAMGKTAHIRDMIATGLRFLTALTITEYSAYSGDIPYQSFVALEINGDDEEKIKQTINIAAQTAKDVGMRKVDDSLYVLDLGSIERTPQENSRQDEENQEEVTDAAIHAMHLCQRIENSVATGRYRSYGAAGAALGLKKSLVAKYRELGKLIEEIQHDVLDGKATGCSISSLIKIGKIGEAEKQRKAFDELISNRSSLSPRKSRKNINNSTTKKENIRLRGAIYFNPDRFVKQRHRAQQKIDRVFAFVDNLNAQLMSPRSNRSRENVAAAVDRTLRKDKLLTAFQYEVVDLETTKDKNSKSNSDERRRLRVEIKLDQSEWEKRRRYDGFVFLVAHPELPHSAEELCLLYRAKDRVEKDFEDIKSFVELRPIFHRIEPKIRAHTSICMLSLLLRCTLNKKLGHSKYTTGIALEHLRGCHLNRYTRSHSGYNAYNVTETSTDQAAILRTIRLEHLADDDVVLTRLNSR